MSGWESDLGWNSERVRKRPARMTWPQAGLVWLLPMSAHLCCLLMLSAVDPCNDNPGCMAGSLSAYAAILLMPAVAILIAIIAVLQKLSDQVTVPGALVANTIVALLPYAAGLVFAWIW